MKPVIAYAAHTLPMMLEFPIIRKRISEKLDRNFNNKTEFTNYVDSIKASQTVDSYVGITCSCGKKYDYATKNAIPSSNVVCTCGRDILIYGN